MYRLLPILALCACSMVNPMTALRLSTTDPLTADPSAIALALTLPAGLRLIPGTARLEFGATRGEELIGGSFTLQERDSALWLTAADVARMRDLQTQIAQWKAEGPAQGSLGVGLGACAVGSGPAPDATGSVFIKLEEGGDFLPLITRGRIADLIGPEVLADIGPCAGPE